MDPQRNRRFPKPARVAAVLALLAGVLIAGYANNASQAERWADEERTAVVRLESSEAEVSVARRGLASLEKDLDSRRGANRKIRSQVERQRDAIAVLEERVRELGGDPDAP